MVDFPSSPTNGQTYSFAGAIWTYDGTKWGAASMAANYLPLAGGTLTGALTLAADPAAALQASTKQYSDLKVPLLGGTMTGILHLKGVIDASLAAAGEIGETISGGQATAQTLTTATPFNLVTLALTAGDWVLSGNVFLTPTGAAPSSITAAIGQTSATLPTAAQLAAGTGALVQLRASWTNAQTQTLQIGPTRINQNAAASAYLMAQATFSGGSVTATGYISARRVR